MGYRKRCKRSEPDEPPANKSKKRAVVIEEQLETHIIQPYVNQSNLTNTENIGTNNFQLLKVLGAGSAGTVFLVRKRGGSDNDCLYAMKVLRKVHILKKKRRIEYAKNEREILEAIGEKPFLVTLHYAFQTAAKLYLILNYSPGGNLKSQLKKREHFIENEVQIYVGEIILAIEQLHKLGIIHRDLKLENIVLDESGHVVVTDFGLSKKLQEGQRSRTCCGTIEYMAPEVINCKVKGYDASVDWWSVGIITFILLSGKSPFRCRNTRFSVRDIAKRILKSSPPSLPHWIGEDTNDFISKLLEKNVAKRLGSGPGDAEQLKRHSFFNNLQWDKLERKEIPAPFKPILKDPLDVSNFNKTFTRKSPIDSTASISKKVNKLFIGYSYP